MKKLIMHLMYVNIIFTNCVTFNLNLNNYYSIHDGVWLLRVNGSWNNWGLGFDLSDANVDFWADYILSN